NPVSILGNLFQIAAARDGERLLGDHVKFIPIAGLIIAVFDEKPLRLAALRRAAAPHEVPNAAELFAVQLEFQLAGAIPRCGIVERLPTAVVSEHDRAAAVFAFRDDALKRTVFDRTISDLDCQPLIVGIEARAFRYGPTLKHVAELQTKV